jgi:hypothetical protein
MENVQVLENLIMNVEEKKTQEIVVNNFINRKMKGAYYGS